MGVLKLLKGFGSRVNKLERERGRVPVNGVDDYVVYGRERVREESMEDRKHIVDY